MKITKVREIQTGKLDNSSSDDEYVYSVTQKIEHVSAVNENGPRANVIINDKVYNFLIDSGATTNILDERMYNKLGKPKLSTGKHPTLFPYGGGKPLSIMGRCELKVEKRNKIETDTFCIVEGNHGALLGYPLSKKLGLITIVNHISDPKTEYPKLFNGIGKYKGTH